MMADADIEQIEMRLVLDAIFERYGYDLRDYAEDSMRRRLRSALARSECAHFGELLHRILSSPALFTQVLNQLTVQVSEMFRDPPSYRTFRERVVPVLRTYPQLKIWHAGCASGEEAYTTAIILHEEKLLDRAQVYATDLCETAIEQGRDGVYSEARAESFKRNYEESGGQMSFADYFTVGYGRRALRDALKRNVVFFQHNLVSDHALGEMHVIFCRNVLIYFGRSLTARVLGMFSKALCRGGFLCLGSSERLPRTPDDAFEEFDASGRIYRLKGAR